jgi:hypothetical protein
MNPMYPNPMMQHPMMQNSMMQNPMMQNQMYQNPMMQHQMESQLMHCMCYPMMSGMYNPPTYAPQMLQQQYQPTEGTNRAPYYQHSQHHGYYPSHNYYNPYHHYYNPYYQNYYPYYNLNPLLIPLLFGRD